MNEDEEDDRTQWVEAISLEEVAESEDGSDYQRDAYQQWLALQQEKTNDRTA
jgi:hypothetical protein